jgi:MazG family protein
VGEVLANWEQIKLKEKGRKSTLDGVPATLPALLRAHRTQEKAAGVGFDFPEAAQAWDKVSEEIEEFRQRDVAASQRRAAGGAASGPAAEDLDGLEDELGDVLFAIVNYARIRGLNAENALRRTNDKFVRRFQHVETRIREQGRGLHESDLEEMDRYWDEAKAEERAK